MELLLTTVQKERSSVRILRHQVLRKPNDAIGAQFVILRIIQYLPSVNGNQVLKCLLIEDESNIFDIFTKDDTSNIITVIIVPEISGTVDVNNKFDLKVYKPWIILDAEKKLIQISRFVFVPETDLKNVCSRTKNIVDKRKLKNIMHFECPCTVNKNITNICKFKFKDSFLNVYDEVFSYK